MIGVPARDLTLAEIKELGLDIDFLCSSGLYRHDYAPIEVTQEQEEPKAE
jgi:hypothetical protein